MEEKVTKALAVEYSTEIISLPSKGKLYLPNNPLSSGTVEMRYMTAKHEDILTNESYIKSGVVIDKLIEALIVSPINLDDVLIGDKNAILVAARVLGYGKDYEFEFGNEKHVIDLTTIKKKLMRVCWLIIKTCLILI